MKKFKLYSYTILLLISMLLVCPWIFAQIWKSSRPQKPPKQNVSTAEPTTTTPNDVQDTTMNSPDAQPQTEIPTEPPLQFQNVSTSYFDDALFIGDSRTVGISEYGTLKNASYFCNTGMSVYNLGKKSEQVKDVGNITLEALLTQKQYAKIYIMLGINELGYEFNQTVTKYHEWVNYLREKQPDAIIIIQGNLHVTLSRSQTDSYITNPNINQLNSAISSFADGEHIFYIDPNELFDDETGSLNPLFSNDTVHLTGSHYPEWCGWLCTKAIVTPEMAAASPTEPPTAPSWEIITSDEYLQSDPNNNSV